MKRRVLPTEPLLFLKPTTSYIREPMPIRLPEATRVDHEVELGVVIGKNGRNIPEDRAMDFVAGYCIALDLTARDIQAKCKAEGLPWTISKGFDTFCPIGDYIPKNSLNIDEGVQLMLEVNGEVRQKASTADMIFKIPFLVHYISRHMRLEAGDLILTGTPRGIGPLNLGDVVVATLGHDYSKAKFRCMPAPKLLSLDKDF